MRAKLRGDGTAAAATRKQEGGRKLKKMIKRVTAFLVSVIMLAMTFTVLASADDSGTSRADHRAVSVNVYMNGEQVLAGRSLLIDSVTYVSLRSFAELVDGGKVSWDAATRTAYITNGSRRVSATDGNYYIYADGRYFYTVERVRIINDTMYVPIRPIARAFGVEVGWDNIERAVSLTDTGVLPISGSKFYDSNDVYWLSRIISAEAKGESFKGQMAVGNVVLNRVASPQYPNTIYGVIFDRRGGTQFSPVSFGTIYHTPTALSVIAAKICLEGYSLSNKVLFFMNPRISTSDWISRTRTFEFRLGNHDFYS